MAPKEIQLVTGPRPTEWPDESWATAAIADDLWQPVPFHEYVLKLHSRCNLSCDYCYMYELADQSWRDRSGGMSKKVFEQAAYRIGEHIAANNVEQPEIIFHGGEPLLLGKDFFPYATETLRRSVPEGTDLSFSVQTNGVLLDEEFLDVLVEQNIMVGLSIDGDQEAHDRHRGYANGNGSYEKVARAARLLGQERYRGIFGGLLCVIDLANDPVGTYESLLDFAPPMIDFLLPHGTWSAPPPHRTADPAQAPYADWLIAIFERWYSAPRQETNVRILRSIINQILAGRSRYDGIGLAPTALIAIETTGTVEQICTLKSSYEGATATGLDIFEDGLDLALRHPGVMARQVGAAALSDTCQKCEIRDICGGGHYPHRYREGSGYRNPSVYCADLFRLIGHVKDRVTTDLQRLEENAR